MKRFFRRLSRDSEWSDSRFIAIRSLMIFASVEKQYGAQMAMRARRRLTERT